MKANKLGFRKFGWILGQAAVLLITAALWATPAAAIEPVCGDGTVQAPEACDDGNITSGDGCSAICQFENPFACTGEAFTVRYSPAELFIIDQQASPFAFNPVDLNGPAVGNEAIYAVLDVDGDGNDDPIELNNLGFRSTDGLLYAMALKVFVPNNSAENGNYGIVQIDANGNIFGPLVTSGEHPIPAIPDSKNNNYRFAAGDVAPSGDTFVINSLVNNTSDSPVGTGFIYIVDLRTLVVTRKTKDFGTDVPANLNVADWAYNPIDGMLYGASKDDGHIYMLDPDFGDEQVQITRVTESALLPTGAPSINAYGGVWFNASGRAFFYRNVGEIYEVDLDLESLPPTPTIISVQSGGPESIYNDAASCALGSTGAPLLNVEKTVTTADGTCPGEDSLGISLGDTVTYCYVVTNNADEGDLYDVMLLDDNGTPDDPSDDFSVTLFGLTDEDEDGNSDDLAAGGSATGEAPVAINTTGVVTNTATASGFDEGGLERFDSDTAQVYESGKFPFECTETAYVIQGTGGIPSDEQSWLTEIDQSVSPFVFDQIPDASTFYGGRINNLGFNPVDGLLYAWRIPSTTPARGAQLLTIDALGTITPLGTAGLPMSNPAANLNAGDVRTDGTEMYLSVYGGSGTPAGAGTPQYPLWTVDLATMTSSSMPIKTSENGRVIGRVNDLAYNPVDGLLYGGDQDHGELAIVDPATGIRTDIPLAGLPVDGTPPVRYGGAYFGFDGTLYLYENVSGSIYPVFDVTGTPTLGTAIEGTRSTDVDAASCASLPEEEPILPLRAEKTAEGSYDRTIEWTLDKSVDAASHTGFAGQAAGTSNWTVVADKTETLGNFQVTGSITVYNENAFDVPVTVRDVLSDGTEASVDCPSNTVPAAVLNGALTPGQLTCTYQASPADGLAELNTATITTEFPDVEGATATATIGWSEGNTFGYDSGTLSDDNPNNPNGPTVISDDTTWNYSQAFTCPKDLGLYDANGKHSFNVPNTATLNDNINLSDTENVMVDCYIPLISKTANGSYDQTHTWDVEKSVDPESQSGFAGDSLDWTWTVNVSETSADSNFKVSGVITLSNPNPDDVLVVVITDTANGNPPSTIGLAPNPATNCNLTSANGITWTLGPGETGTCNYVSSVTWQDWADVPTQNDVRAHLNWGTPERVAVKHVEPVGTWTANVINGTATVGDDQEPDLPLTLTAGQGPWQWTETQEQRCSTDMADYATGGTYSDTRDNTATVTGSNGQTDSSDAQTTYDCYAPVVSKDASASYDERHTWDVEKSVDPVSQSGNPGDTLQWTWTVDVSESSVDENFSVTGSIDVTNPAGSPGEMTVFLADALSDGTSATVDCGGDATSVEVASSVTVAPGATATCSYSASPADASATVNTATGTFNGIDFTATAAVDFVKNVLNGTAKIDDDQEPDFPLTLIAGEGPGEWTETQNHTCSTDIADYAADGTYSETRYNTATVTGSDGQSDSASAETTYTCEAGTVEVLKYTDGVVNDTYDWSFALYIGPDGFGGAQVGTTSSTLGDADGILDFGDPVPALSTDTTYTVCELSIAAGWATEWNIDGVIVIPYNPNADDSPPEDLGNRCFDVGSGTSYQLTVGQNLRITVDNTFPGGDPRTPGYWKNWSSCTDGGQFEKTTDGVDPDNEYVSLDEVLNDPGVSWCEFTIESCVDAVSILDQRDIASGKKMSSDSAYTLAMHLLAAELNFGAGAERCEWASDAMLYARDLLCQIDFNGTGSYLRPKGRTYDDYYDALDLKDLLDDYNNGRLCGEEIATDFPPQVSIVKPAEGDAVSGSSVSIEASTYDDNGVTRVEFFVGGVSIGVDSDASDGWSAAWDSTAVADDDYTIRATATDTSGQTGSDSIVVKVDNVAGHTMHVGDLDADTATGNGGKWDATVTITVHDLGHSGVGNATVSGAWVGGAAASCTTDGSGQCTVTRSNGRKVSTVTFTVDSVSAAGYDYAAAHNHDPDGDSDSDGTRIVIGTP
jgi:cysteine-rich repeat protein